MSLTGKTVRLKKFFGRHGKVIIAAPTHNMARVEPMPGQINMKSYIQKINSTGITAVLMGKGSIKITAPVISRDIGIINHIRIPIAYEIKTLKRAVISNVEESIRLGADGICAYIGLSTGNDREILETLAALSGECDKWGIVLLAEACFPDVWLSEEENMKEHGFKYLMHAVRICSELGCDIISTIWPGDPDKFAKMVEYAQIPVLINGGTVTSESKFLKKVELSLEAGGSGVLGGRNFTEENCVEKIASTTKLIEDFVKSNSK